MNEQLKDKVEQQQSVISELRASHPKKDTSWYIHVLHNCCILICRLSIIPFASYKGPFQRFILKFAY